jgi:hypothetical protein
MGPENDCADGSTHASNGYDNAFVWLRDVITSASASCHVVFDFDV